MTMPYAGGNNPGRVRKWRGIREVLVMRNKKWGVIAIAALAAVLVFGFAIVPKLMASPPETSGIESVVSDTDPLAETDPVEGDTDPGSSSGGQEVTGVITISSDDVSNGVRELTFGFTTLPNVNQISWEQAYENAASILADFGYEVDTPSPLDVSNSGFMKDFWINYYTPVDPVYDPTCYVYIRYNHEVPGEIEIQEYLDSEAFKGMSEAEIREIIDADDLSNIKYKPNTKHPKFRVLDGESCTIYFEIELNALTGEAMRGWETRVRYGEELEFGEISYFGMPLWDSDGYYTRLYY